ncbi:MAG: hypothetical protein FD188_3239 [Ignavibacteria bacterium]|nr:MAG: hypothetical protein FD188_3239 [Ignavibacteria bacterium]
MSLYAIDFFCGAGGLTRGLLDAGINVIAGIDNSLLCKETYEYNNSPARFICEDIKTLNSDKVRELISAVSKEDLVFAACAPCQPFARLNKNGRNDDSRLLGSFANFLEIFLPKYVFIENVDGLKKVKGYSTYLRFKKRLSDLGYEYIESILNAKDYGVPQSRRRLILIAARDIKPILPIKTNGKNLIPFNTVADAISKFPPIIAGESNSSIPNHKALRLSEKNLKRIKSTSFDGGGRDDWNKDLWLDCHLKDPSGHSDVYGRMKWNQPSPTLTCKCCSLSNGRYGHPTQNRAISFREAASLQSFNENYIFFANSKKDLGKQIGNAVPVRLAQAIGKSIVDLHESTKKG